jgi:rRNA maturation endonuclease Nob1
MPEQPPERPRTAAYYHSPAQKYARHARKRCLGCGVAIQGRYWLLDRNSWACARCGADALRRDVPIGSGR